MPVETKIHCESMDAEFDRHFGVPESALSAEARRHLAECARCRTLYQYLSEAAPSVAVSPGLNSRIERRLKSSLRPVKAMGSTRAIAARLFLLFLLLAIPVARSMDMVGWQLMNRGQLTGVTIVLIAGAALLSFSLAWQMTPGSLQRIPATGAIVILAASFLLVVSLLFPWHTPEGFFRLGWRCLKMGIMMTVPAAALFGFLVWRGAPLGPGALGASLGAVAGLLSITILQFNCDTQEAIHLLVWHGAVLVLSTCVGFLIGRAVDVLRRYD
jgi:hypothetical protein